MGLKLFLYVVISTLICFIILISCNQDTSMEPHLVTSIDQNPVRCIVDEGSPSWKVFLENGDSVYSCINRNIGDTIWITSIKPISCGRTK